MLRFRALKDAAGAASYYGKTDGGYYLDSSNLQRELGGKGAALLGLDAKPDFEQFTNLLQGLHPVTGHQLTAKLIEGRLSGWDVTASVPKGVTLAIEHGDSRVHAALWEAGRETMADLEALVTTRKRKGGEHADRVTGNLIWYGFEHPETRPNRQDGMPDPDRHVHFIIPNVTFDPFEKQWKAIKFRPLFDLRKYFDRRFDGRLAIKLSQLGYEIETKRKDGKYYSWDIKGMPEAAVKKFSRRAEEIEKLADKLGIERAVSKDKLAATSRLHKRDDMTLQDYRKYWKSRLTLAECRQIDVTIKAAIADENPSPSNTVAKGVEYAVAHEFERRSVIDWHDLAVTAMERCMGGAHPDAILPEAIRQGVLLEDGEATTRDVLAEETRLLEYARLGKGTMAPLSPENAARTGKVPGLSDEQECVARHIWGSTDRVIVVEGDPGVGKTRTMQRTIPGIEKNGVFLAPSAAASRGTLRTEGFTNADTIARFLIDENFREKARNGYIYIDEAPMAGLSEIDEVFRHAKELGARVIAQGDRKQHLSITRGNLFEILEKFAGLPIAKMKENWRQKHDGYREAVVKLSAGDTMGCYDILYSLGWIKQVEALDDNRTIVADYFAAVEAGKNTQAISPTHQEGQEVTQGIRKILRDRNILDPEDKEFLKLVTLGWTNAQKADVGHYDGSEVVQYYRRTGSFNAGQRVYVKDFKSGQNLGDPKWFSVFREEQIGIAKGDMIRTTANVKSIRGERIDNGSYLKVTGITPDGGLTVKTPRGLDRTLPSDVAFIDHAYVITSRAGQSRTLDVTLGTLGRESLGAMNVREFLVDITRARYKAIVYTDMSQEEFHKAIQKQDLRKSATELMKPKEKPRRKALDRMKCLLKKARERLKELQATITGVSRDHSPRKEQLYAGIER